MTAQEAHKLVEKHGSQVVAARTCGMSRSTFRRLLASDEATTIRTSNPADLVAPARGGFSLQGKHLLAQRPTDVWKGRFHALRRGMGFRIETLTEEWACSRDTLRSKAKAHGSLRYIEDPDAPGVYVECVVHPETPKGR